MNEHIVDVPWNHQHNIWWSEICAQIIEHFGLPGDRYTSHPTEDNMSFIFKNNKDALMCRLLISENI